MLSAHKHCSITCSTDACRQFDSSVRNCEVTCTDNDNWATLVRLNSLIHAGSDGATRHGGHKASVLVLRHLDTSQAPVPLSLVATFIAHYWWLVVRVEISRIRTELNKHYTSLLRHLPTCTRLDLLIGLTSHNWTGHGSTMQMGWLARAQINNIYF